MVKFGKYIATHTKEEWKDKYINYNFLKKSIKNLKNQQKKETQEYVNVDEIINILKKESMDKGDIETPERLKLENLIKQNLEKYEKEFLHSLDQEMKKFFEFFTILEKKTYSEMKRHLYLEGNYSNLSLSSVFDEIQKLENVCQTTLDLANFINVNVTAIRKILKKFDKIFKLYENPLALYYLKKNLTDVNSPLFHILQFKIIDETSALIEKLSSELELIFTEKTKKLDKSHYEDLLTEKLLKEVNLSMISGMNESRINNFIYSKFQRIHELTEKIDDSNNLIRSNIEIWSLLIKSNILMIQEKDKNHDTLTYIQQEKILEKLTPQIKTEASKMSYDNLWNVWICLIHTFAYTMNCWIVQPTNYLYIEKMNVSPFYTGLIMGLTPFAAIFSTILYSYWTNFNYKSPLVFSCFCFFIGNFLYSFADYFDSIMVMGLGRFLIGFGGGRVINRRYLIDHVPKDYIMLFSLLYVVATCLGMAAGPGFALGILYIPDYNTDLLRMNIYTNPGWFSLLFWVIFFFIILLKFDESAYKKLFPKTSNNETNIMDKLEVNFYQPPHIAQEDEIQNDKRNKEGKIESSDGDTASVIVVQREIQEMLHEEEKAFSYMGTAFIILVSVLLVIRMNTECLMVLAPVTLPYDYGLSLTMVSLFFVIAALLVLPVCKLIDHLSKKYKERQLLFILLVICMFSSLFLIKMFWVISIYQYMFFYTSLFICTNLLESVASSLTAKIFPTTDDSNTPSILNSGFVIIMAVTGGKFLGAFLVTVFGILGHENIQNITFWFYGILFGLLSFLTWRNYDSLRVKAIAKIKMKEEILKN